MQCGWYSVSIWEYTSKLIVYLFIHDLFYEYNVIIKQDTLQESSFYFIYFFNFEKPFILAMNL